MSQKSPLLNLKGPYLALLAVGLEAAGMFALSPERWDLLRRLLIMCGFGLALIFTWLNRSWRPMQLLALGLLMNLAAMLANGGLMPVTSDNARRAGFADELERLQVGDAIPRSKDVLRERSETLLAPLTDTLVIPEAFPGRGIASPGDVVVAASVAIAAASVFRAMAECTFGGRRTRRDQPLQAPRQT